MPPSQPARCRRYDYTARGALCSAGMRLITFEDSVRRSRAGALAADGRIVDLNSACALYLRDVENESAFYRLAEALVPPNMRELFAGGDTGLEAARKALDYVLESDSATGARGEPIFYPADEIFMRAPIVPGKFFHASGFRNVDAIIGHEEPVIYPGHLTQELDSEVELAIVLKKTGKHFASDEASGYVGGYIIFNHLIARDIQRREMKYGASSLGHAIDTFCPLGPWIITAEEVADPHQLAMELRVNGEPWQKSHSSKISMTVGELLCHYSPMGYTAGDVVSTGTVAAGSADSKARYLKAGDVLECEIEKIGTLRNHLISWEEAYGNRPAALTTKTSK